ncbi:YceI family protein [Candidatus Sumerlaeota bacterium]|nr:YceI family protein [Candidatus Sumerlaeota bacterium]
MKSLRYILAAAIMSTSLLVTAHETGQPHVHDAAKASPTQSTPGTIKWHGTKDNGEHFGTFRSWRITKADVPGGDITKGTVELEFDLTSLETTPPKLVEHLKSSDFFDVAKYGTAKVTISNAKPAADKDGNKSFDADAKVEMRGLSSTVKANFVVLGEKPLKVKGTAILDRTPFKMEYDTKKPGAVHAAVDVTIEATIPEKVEDAKAGANKDAKPQATSAAAPEAATPVSSSSTTLHDHNDPSHKH